MAGRRIVVSGNCHVGAIATAVAAMLPDDHVEPIACYPEDPATEAATGERLRHADAWVTLNDRSIHARILDGGEPPAEVVALPNLRFFGYHPDIAHVGFRDGGVLVTGAVGPYNSALVLGGWRLGLTEEQIVGSFVPEVCDALGYTTFWPAAVEELKRRVDRSDLGWGEVYLPLAQGEPFMLTDNHPRLNALIHLARLAAGRLGADPDLVAFPWDQVLPDGLLATSEVWPVYPAVARQIGLRGGYVWRSATHGLIDLPTFVRLSLETYRAVDPETLVAPAVLDPPDAEPPTLDLDPVVEVLDRHHSGRSLDPAPRAEPAGDRDAARAADPAGGTGPGGGVGPARDADPAGAGGQGPGRVRSVLAAWTGRRAAQAR
ncbi:hypothetical protein HC251_06515 [Iamia sp. SCSIO 61187]|uniref:WcbI family polysaccharide biosynthesis putative acetyltransferase n=1 Tax=Iamia sp. SCSIO 61187 TaxID=2722752 RepID=UPI001C63803C|nr:WcbI family polysaccharide biosynthesis putative acetyltransferase [Iamia sp. SCSIO 61187]QYG92126.1 hypothetical protein HC251_06515 [Iamia sp. SCSIO 61187]